MSTYVTYPEPPKACVRARFGQGAHPSGVPRRKHKFLTPGKPQERHGRGPRVCGPKPSREERARGALETSEGSAGNTRAATQGATTYRLIVAVVDVVVNAAEKKRDVRISRVRANERGAARPMSAGRKDVLGDIDVAASASASAAASAVAATEDERRGDAEEDERQNGAHRPHGYCSSLQKALCVRGRAQRWFTGGGRARGRRRGRGACRKAGKRGRTRARESSVARRRRSGRAAADGGVPREIRPKQRGGGRHVDVPQRSFLSVGVAEPPTEPTFEKNEFRS